MADDAEYDSSDYEDLPPQNDVNEFATAGSKIAQQILENQLEDRRLTKRAARTLQLDRGAPSTRFKQQAIAKMVKSFMQSVGKQPDACPNSEDFFRFVATLVQRIKPGITAKNAVSLTTIQAYWANAVSYCDFTFRKVFRESYDRQQLLRIETHLDQEVRRGNLFRGKWRKGQWIGFKILKEMCVLFLRAACNDGCFSWDIVIGRYLSILLQSACVARPGDVARSNLYKGKECICWDDIRLELEPGGSTINDLRGVVTLRFTKWDKSDINKDEIMFFDPMTEPSLYHLCVVRMILVHALRHGRCHGTTVQEVIQHTMQQPSRCVVWTAPDMPVISAIRPNCRAFLDVDKPAAAKQLNMTIKMMGLISGILAPITARHLRNGAIRDIANLKKKANGAANNAARQAAGHSRTSYNSGTTELYSGPMQQSFWNLRAAEPFNDRLAPKVDADKALSFQRKPRQPLVSNPSRVNQTITVGHPSSSSSVVPQKRPRSPSPKPAQLPPSDQPLDMNLAVIDPQLLESPDRHGLEVDAPLLEAAEQAQVNGPELQGLCDTLERGAAQSPDNARLENGDDDSSTLVDNHLLSLFNPPAEPWPTEGDGSQFVDFFAGINIYRHVSHWDRSSEEEVRRRVPTGNSRQYPVPFMFACSKGCGYSSYDKPAVNVHEVGCKGPKSVERVFPCPYEGCETTSRTQKDLACHISAMHKFQPRTCTHGCTDGRVFTTSGEYANHLKDCHDDYEAQQCPLKTSCHYQKMFKTRSALQQHLRVHHQIAKTGEYLAPRNSTRQPDAFEPKKCVIDNCPSTKVFSDAGTLRQHLWDNHQLSDDEVDAAVPLQGNASHRVTKRTQVEPRADIKCPQPGCKTKANISLPGKFKLHLKDAHKMSEDDAHALAEQVFDRKVTRVDRKKQEITHSCPKNPEHKTAFPTMNRLIRHLEGVDKMAHDAAVQLAETTFGRRYAASTKTPKE